MNVWICRESDAEILHKEKRSGLLEAIDPPGSLAPFID